MRKKRRYLRQILMAAIFSGAIHLNADSLYQNLETFHADYLEEEVDAAHADGQTAATVLHQATATFDINPVTGKNEGLKTGSGNVSLSYPTADNLPSTAGSIEIRFKPVDWDPTQDTYNIIFQTATSGATPPAKLLIYKYKQSGIAAYLSIADTLPTVFLYKNISTWQNHIYHHVVVTYDVTGDVVLFVDGTEAGRATIGTPSDPAIITWPTAFTVGAYSSGFGYADGQASIERVRIYDTSLDANQVQYLADKTEFNQLIGAYSQWFEDGRPQLGLAALDKDTVPPQWTPVTYATASATATCWNRVYDFSGNGLMSNVTSGSESLLNGPVSLDITVGGQSGTISFGTPTVVEQGDGRIILARTGSFGSTSATLEYTFEYDGLLWCDLALTLPSGSSLEGLKLKVPFKKDAAQLTHYVGAPAIYTSQNLPKNSYGKAIPYTTGVHHESGLKTMVWIGNNRYGMLWCMESDQYWWPKDRSDCITIERLSDGNVDFCVDMVSGTLPGNAPQTLNYRFGLMATPIKPMPEGWRAWTHTDQATSRTGDLRGINLFYWPSEYRFMMLDQDPTRYVNIQATQDKITADQNNTERRYILPYWTRTNIYDEREEADPADPQYTVIKVLPEAPLMTREWGTMPHGTSTYRLSAATGWSDYLVWNLEEFVNVMGHADGFYMDEVQPIPNDRAESNGGYDALDSTRRPTFEMFGTRNLIKRMTYNTWQRNQERPRALAHCSGTQTANAIGGCDLWLIGEQYNSGYFWENPELKPPAGDSTEEVYYYSYALPMDRVRAECCPQQWGEIIVWLPQLKDQPDIMTNPTSTRDMLSRVMQADVVIWPLWCNSNEVYKTWEYRREYDIGQTGVQFNPYWEQAEVTVTETPCQGWWTFNDGSGTSAVDKSGYDNDGVLVNMAVPGCWVDGAAGKALRFANDGGYVDCGYNLDCDSLTSYTVTCRLKPETSGIAGRHIVETWTNSTSGFAMQLYNNDKLCSYQSVNGSIYNLANYVPFPHDNEFHHVAVTVNYDGTDCTMKTYIDGTLQAESTVTGTPDPALTGRPMHIGHGAYTGIIDDVKFFARTLSADEVAEESGKIQTAVKLDFDDATGTVAADKSSHGLNGTLVNMNQSTAWSTVDGERSIRFSADGGYANCGASSLFEADNYTVEFRIKPESSGVAGRHLVETWTGNTSGFAIQLYSNDKLCSYQSVNGSIYTLASYVPFPHDGKFHHVAVSFSYDGTTSTMKTYIDGVLELTNSTTGAPDTTLPGRQLHIGHGDYDGNMSGFKFHTRVLSDAEIAAAAEKQSDPALVAGYYSNSSDEYLMLISNLDRKAHDVAVDFKALPMTSVKDAETETVLPLNNAGKLILKMNRNDYRALRVNY